MAHVRRFQKKVPLKRRDLGLRANYSSTPKLYKILLMECFP